MGTLSVTILSSSLEEEGGVTKKGVAMVTLSITNISSLSRMGAGKKRSTEHAFFCSEMDAFGVYEQESNKKAIFGDGERVKVTNQLQTSGW
ncbi:hypothetical protein AVEN_97908-1 [Araneus ventricosus]|uniref:Uncharacterized protein n=1 Tax=Araneus ventricosus TaxID=182803 RepID=A0A4Y2HUB5_ARAVE|nr:hypothetical protein AVEN_97908-1 [Araneus ventricosus]